MFSNKRLYKLLYMSLCLFLLAINSCKSQVDFRVEFAKELEQIMLVENPKKLDSIKKALILDDSVFGSMDVEIDKALGMMNNSELMKAHLDSISNSSLERNIYCTILLHRQINNRNLDEIEVLGDWKFLIEKQKILKSMDEKKKLKQLNIINDKKYNIGDTVAAFFIKELDFEPPRMSYSKYMPDSLYYMESDYFKILGVVEKKTYTLIDSQNDSNSLVFTINILAMNESNVYNGNDLISLGSKIDIEVNSYGRVLGTQENFYKWGQHPATKKRK